MVNGRKKENIIVLIWKVKNIDIEKFLWMNLGRVCFFFYEYMYRIDNFLF